MAVGCPQLSHWDRLVIDGDPGAAADLVRVALPEMGPGFRPFGVEELVEEVVARVPELEVSARFAWMEITEPVRWTGGGTSRAGGGTGAAARPGAGGGRPAVPDSAGRPVLAAPAWLSEAEWPDVTALIEESFPDSYARPGDPDVRRWAGLRDSGGRLLAVAADAWSTADIGFLAGVTTHPDARGRGLGTTLCAFVADELLAGRERVALLVDYWNTAAMATYQRLGFTMRRVAAARQR